MNRSFALPAHTARRLAEHGEALVAIPVEPQPELQATEVYGLAAVWRYKDTYWRGDHSELMVDLHAPYRPGDAVTLSDWPACRPPSNAGELLWAEAGQFTATVTAADCKPVRDVTAELWEQSGIPERRRLTPRQPTAPRDSDPYALILRHVSDVAREMWNETHAHRGPEYAWDRAWAFLVTVRRDSDA